MAAWSNHDDRAWAEFQTKRLAEVVDEVVDNARQDLKEPFPSDTFELFSDSDLDQLVVDACREMGRRELERKNLAERGIYVNPNQS